MNKNHHSRLHILKVFMAVLLFAALSINSHAAGNVEFLGQPTSIMDRVTPSGEQLSDVLQGIDNDCEAFAESGGAKGSKGSKSSKASKGSKGSKGSKASKGSKGSKG
ncbi:MAG: hypothetical protein HKN85_07375, partial [Gammaproteobacteria bacterium]|nr:hypothetical protein [Gammaproteobacteria bacterium]